MLNSRKCKLPILLLIFMLITALVACTAGPAAQNPEVSTVPAPESVAEAAPEAGEDGPFTPYTDAIEITVGGESREAEAQWEDGDSVDNNPFVRQFKSDLNIDATNYWVADVSQYVEKVNMSIASNDLPDVMRVNNVQFAQITKAGLAYDLTDLFDKYASDDLKGYMAADEAGFESGKVDGRLLGLSQQHYGIIAKPDVVWIRDDWMKKFNLSAPKTLDELIQICEIFTTQDPDGNGVADTYGLALTKDIIKDDMTGVAGLSIANGLFNAYHAYPKLWIKNAEGQIVYGSVQPEMKLALQKLQDMYKTGLISKEFAVKDTTKVNEDLINGKVGVEIGECWNGYWPVPDVIKQNGAEAIFKPYAIPSADDEPIKLSINWPVNSYLVVSKDCKNPEAVLKLINLRIKFTKYTTTEQFSKFEDFARYSGPAGILNVYDPMLDYNSHVEVVEALKTKDPSKLMPTSLPLYDGILRWQDSQDADSVGFDLQMGEEGSYSILKQVIDDKAYVLSEYRGIDTPTMVEKKATLEKLEIETYTKIIMGEAPIEEFDKMVEAWNKLGGEDITKEINEMYNK